MALPLTPLNCLVDSLCHSRKLGEAVRLIASRTLEPEQYSVYSKILRLCTDLNSRKCGQLVHFRLIAVGFPTNTCLNTRLIMFYSKCGEMKTARKVFDKMSERSVVTWTALISGYSQNADYEEALRAFSAMHGEGARANQFTYGSALRACTRLLCLELGKQIQGCLQKGRFVDNLFIQSALVDLHSKCGKMEDARCVFDSMETRDLVCWNAMIGGYAAQGLSDDAILVFRSMLGEGLKPNGVTLLSILFACSHNGLSTQGWEWFRSVVKQNDILLRAEHYSCLVDVLARADCLEEEYGLIRGKIPMDIDASALGAMLGACSVHVNVNLGEIVARRLFDLEPGNAVNYVVLSGIYSAAGMWRNAMETRVLMEKNITAKYPGYSSCQ
ncbi:hypothetical protein MIMGU_mgv1a019698mg [Erythranthe guttata]|uniref:Pentacotripeptide-repeat region of PRORP domain-containing protein n=1 Tax=Erythranthe guttata TaxID=4155 RepID=A0A022QJ24_ERYGU|nr:hypothetical protein MIMGU_mgv1a019698mg [Erythranthe guttata]